MKKNDRNLMLLYMLFGIALVTANCIGGKVFNLGVTFLGAPVTLTVGVLCYPFTFLITDVIGEMWGKKEAGRAVFGGFLCPGHVATIIGERGFRFLAEDYGMPAVISGFEPEDILLSVYALLRQIREGGQLLMMQNLLNQFLHISKRSIPSTWLGRKQRE